MVEKGTHRELLARGGLYRRLYEMQFRYEPPEEPEEAPTIPAVAQGASGGARMAQGPQTAQSSPSGIRGRPGGNPMGHRRRDNDSENETNS